MFEHEYGLVPNRSTPDKFVRLVRWEGAWSPSIDPEYETYNVVPVVVERTLLDVSNPRSLQYNGPEWRLVPTAVTELTLKHWPVHWPGEAPTETETMRRERIRAARRMALLNDDRASVEPTWVDAPSSGSFISGLAGRAHAPVHAHAAA